MPPCNRRRAFNITIDATNLKPGSYSGTLSFTCQTACVPFSLPVNLVVTSNASLVFTPSPVTFNYYQGRPMPPAQTLSVKSSDGTPVNFTVTNPFRWLTVSSLSGTTPTTLTLTPNLAGITAGVSGNLTFTTANTQPSALLPVVLNVTPFSVSRDAQSGDCIRSCWPTCADVDYREYGRQRPGFTGDFNGQFLAFDARESHCSRHACD